MEDILNIDTEVVESKPSKPVPPKVDKDDRTKDYEYTRGELYHHRSGSGGGQRCLEVAQESGHPRASSRCSGNEACCR